MINFRIPHITLLDNVYITDSTNQRIRKVTVSTGIITTIAGSGGTGSYSGDGGAATSATLYNPNGVTVDSSGITSLNCVQIIFLLSIYRQRIHQ